MSSSTITPITLNGISQYASDFQSILNRAVQTASIPLQSLQNQQSLITQEQADISGLSSAVAAVATDMSTLANLGTTQALSANSSDPSVVTATATGATAATSYTISNVTSVASAASESSLHSYGDATTTPVSSTGTMQLTVGSTNYTITLASGQNNLTGLENAINATNSGVTAQILTASNGDYLSVSANNPGATTLSLTDDPGGANTAILTDQNQGTNTVFQLNGINVSVPETNINNLVPGMVFTINGTTAANQTATVSLSPDSSQLTSALQNLVSDYNSLAGQVNGQIGTNSGALSGNSIIWQVREAMLDLVNYQNPASGSVHNLANLGISVDQTGQMSLDTTQIQGFTNSQLSDAFSFLGSATTGLGALQNEFTQISDPVTGTIEAQENEWTTDSNGLTTKINDMTSQINTMQTLLSSQLEAADANVAELQSQQSLLTSSIQALDYSTYGAQVATQSS